MKNTTLDFYNSNYNDYYNNTVSVDLSKIYLEFTKILPKAASILDLGCGSGRDSLYFKNEGYKVTAIDGSEKLAELASNLIEQDVIVSKFEELEIKDRFGGIWACASLLHLDYVELEKLLIKLEAALVNNGILYMSFKYGSTEFIDDKGRYFNLYTEEKLTTLLDKVSSLEISKLFKTIDVIPGREDVIWLNVLCQRKG
ncbi:tellurite resistance protein TehB [uncultured Clostridium sp.]|uniref:class I SAM-dependent methyltransferase n=1 Tax=uncultured Clostridium sp. TaxID=59620 RepID=UPI0008230E70|nr:class I SAM-dependent methyltransferase [uncultured Clostridium sp.]SCJ99810.1 tellurite resistance protein TehB [uncultured Clostridium sp.]